MIDSVWTSDHHPALCGTAKFSHQLAARLGVPVLPLGTRAAHPLISIRASEVSNWTFLSVTQRFDLFLHDWDDRIIVPVTLAERVYAANGDIAALMGHYRTDVVTLWAPSTIQGTAHRGTINVLTFGMAHKIQPKYYEKLKTLLDATGEDYTVSVSTAIHEGSPWDETAKVADKLRAIFGDRLRVLGYLADDALVAEMARCTHIACFYDPAVRCNNTSFWAAAHSGKPVITNVDSGSPAILVHSIDDMSEFPTKGIPVGVAHGVGYRWDQLIEQLGVPCAK